MREFRDRSASSTRRSAALAAGLLAACLIAGPAAAQALVLDSVSPKLQRVHEMITLRGSGFGAFDPATSKVTFTPEEGGPSFEAGTPYVWRDDFIQVRVPAGNLINGSPTPIPQVKYSVQVVNQQGPSGGRPFEIFAAPPQASLSFVQRTQIVDDRDVSRVLGNPDLNLARTKDAEIGDVDGDGYDDLVDNTSDNLDNGTHGALRLNNRNGSFTAIALEPVNGSDSGVFATEVPPGGTFIGDAVNYDADLVDLTNDGFPELVQALAFPSIVRVLRNTPGGPTVFIEDTAAWIPVQPFTTYPDDVAHTDLDHDGFVDVAIALRQPLGFSPWAEVFINGGGTTFSDHFTVELSDPPDLQESIHDVFFLDADADGFSDLVLVNEKGPSQLFFNDGNDPVGFVAGPEFQAEGASIVTGAGGDFNADGLTDFALLGFQGPNGVVRVYLNDAAQPGTFQRTVLPSPGPGVPYDLELGDVDLDGDIDMVAAKVQPDFQPIDPDETASAWLNDGTGVFTEITAAGATKLLPGSAPYQRLSGDLIDYDRDGDLDLYLTGADGQDIGFGRGAVANQFWENRLITGSVVSPTP